MQQAPIVEEALAEPRLRHGPKRIVVVGPKGPDGNPELVVDPPILRLKTEDPVQWQRIQTDLARLLRQISGPGDVDERYYRKSAQRGDAMLLGRLRAMHLHLLSPGSDVLLYLIQTPDSVLLLGLGTHKHLEDVPQGKAFRIDYLRQAAKLIAKPEGGG